MVFIAPNICIGVTLKHCPIAILFIPASTLGFTPSDSFVPSPWRFNTLLNSPCFSEYFIKSSYPTKFPTLPKTSLQDFTKASSTLKNPWQLFFSHITELQLKVFSNVITPLSSAAPKVISLYIDPGSYPIPSIAKFKFASLSSFWTIALIFPVSDSIIITAILSRPSYSSFFNTSRTLSSTSLFIVSFKFLFSSLMLILFSLYIPLSSR